MFSRSLSYLVRSGNGAKTSLRQLSTSAAKQSGGTWTYRRSPPPASKSTLFKAELFGGFMWFWMLYHIYKEPEHLLGDFPYPDASKWTDAELGIAEE